MRKSLFVFGFIIGLVCFMSHQLNAQSVVSTLPTQNELGVACGINIQATFDTTMNSATMDSTTFTVCGMSSGRHYGVYSYDGPTKTATFEAYVDFKPGEIVWITLSPEILTTDGDSINPYSWSFTIEAIDGSAKFAPKADYSTGTQPYSVFCSDLDSDGDIDLAVANSISFTVSVLLNNGDGTYAPKINYATGNWPYYVFCSDLDSDGDIDLAVANWGPSTVSVLLNNGDGTFAPKTDYSTGTNPRSVFCSDLDSDGDIDLAVANFSPGTVSVLLNNGDGTFAPKTDYSTGTNPLSVFCSDLDSDGDIDLAVANFSPSSVSVLLNNGDGTFAPKTDYATGTLPYSVFCSDLDSDGDIDLAVANMNSNTVSVLLNNGDGTFAPKTDYSTGSNPYSVFCSDLDSDGDIDLAVANYASSSVSVLLNNGDGTFAPKADYPTGTGPRSVFCSDLDSDGDIDLAVANASSNTVSVLLNRSSCQDIELSADSYDFGEVKKDSSEIWSFKIYNVGVDSNLVIDITSSNPVFTPTPTTDTIPPDDSLSVTVIFTPDSIRDYMDSLTISSNDPDEPVVYCVLTGKGIQQDIALSDTTYDFGDVAVSDSSDWTFKIFNLGNTPLDVDSLKNNLTAYQIISPSFPQNIPPNDSVVVTVRFTPDTIKTYQDTLSIFSNDPDEGIVYVYLTGNGIDATPPAAPIGLTANGSNPSPWTRDSTFIINWTNPPDLSGIARALYKLGSAPTSNYDTTGSMSPASPDTVFSAIEGSIPMYVWLEDGSGNVDYNNNSSVNLRYDITPPSTVIIISPQDSAYLKNSTVNFIWNEASDTLSGVDHYVLQYALDNGFSQGLVETTLTDTAFNAVLSDTIYYWHVKAVDVVTNEGAYSTTWQFEVDTQSPNAPILTSPIGGIWLNNTSADFQWSAVTFDDGNKLSANGGGTPFSPIRYILEVDTTTGFISPLVVDTLAATSTAKTLNEDFYYWRVKAYDLAGNQSPYANPDSFGVDITPPVIDSTKIWPDTAYVGPFEIRTKVIDKLAGLDSVLLYYKRYEDPVWVIEIMHQSGDWFTDTIPAVSNLDDTVRYYIKTIDDAEPGNVATDPDGAPASYYSFIANMTGIEETITTPQYFSFGLRNSPARGKVVFNLIIPEASETTLKIYDISGRFIDTPIKGRKSAGVYEIFWTSGGSTGVYFYRLESSWERKSGKFILIR